MHPVHTQLDHYSGIANGGLIIIIIKRDNKNNNNNYYDAEFEEFKLKIESNNAFVDYSVRFWPGYEEIWKESYI